MPSENAVPMAVYSNDDESSTKRNAVWVQSEERNRNKK